MKKEIMYIPPQIEVVTINTEGVLCQSEGDGDYSSTAPGWEVENW